MSDNNNPYAAPSSNLEQEASAGRAVLLPTPKSAGFGRGWGWLAEGFQYFKRSPAGWILGSIIGFIFVIVLSIIPVIGPIIYTLVLYVLVGGVMLGCDAQSRGEQFTVGHVFSAFKNPTKLILLSLVVMLISIVVMVAIMGSTYFKMMTMDPNDTAAAMEIMGDPKSFILQFLIAMLLLLPVTMAVWFAPALIAIHEVPIFKALKMSFSGCLKNVGPFLLFGIIAFVLIVIGSIPLGLGLLVVMPMVTAGSYVAYREIFTA